MKTLVGRLTIGLFALGIPLLALSTGRVAQAQRPTSVNVSRVTTTVQRPQLARDASTAAPGASTSSTQAGGSSQIDAGFRDAGARMSAGAGPNRCPAGMRLVEGEYCPNVDQRCLRWLDPETQMRCAEFEPTRCTGRRRHIAVCMDQYEYPNRRGALPQVMVSWYAARRACAARGARLCSMAEWTFACEGEQMLPYPYGLNRDRDACNYDHQTMRPDRARLGNPVTAADESARLYEAAPSGQYNRCVSPFGINDMTGNVDEWVLNETGQPFQSALKGGWWGPIRGRCRPATLAHNEGFIYYQIGFRCCADPT